MFEGVDNFADIFRHIPYWLLLALPILVISNPVIASSEFNIHRMTQFDLNGISFGCRSSAISLEAKSLYSWSTSRHCVVTKIEDIKLHQFREIKQKAGGLIVLLPRDIGALTVEAKEELIAIENEMLTQSCQIPVYFSPYNAEIEKAIADINLKGSTSLGKDDVQRGSIFSVLFNTVSANGYQVVVTGSSHAPNKNSQIAIIQGELAPPKHFKQAEAMDVNLPLVVVTAHLNTFGIYNEYPVNADVAILMALMEVFSKLYSNLSTSPKYRLMFLLSETGVLLNFQGAKKWMDENVQLQNLEFILCLDTIVKPLEITEGDKGLYMHVSKPPKEGTAMSKFYKHLKSVSQRNQISIEGMHKRINLADQQLSWEHERFSIKRLPAFTMSALKTPKDNTRTTIFRDSELRILKQTEQYAEVIGEALARYIYNIDHEEDGEIFGSTTTIRKLVKSYVYMKSALHNNDLRNAFDKYLKNVKLMYDKPDGREPDFMFFEGQEAILNLYSVKPAVFDLFLTVLISIYLASVYFTIQYFSLIYDAFGRLSKVYTLANGNLNHNVSDRLKVKSN